MNDRTYEYRVVDVFTQTPLEGNPLAVLPMASGLDGTTMQRLAREFNLSETVFVLPSTRDDCDVRYRVFTPTMEMRFAGHPTIGATAVASASGALDPGRDHFTIDEPVGPVGVRVERENGRLWLTTPPIEAGPTFDRALCARVLGLDERDLLDVAPQLLSAGNPNVFVAVRDRAAVDRAWIDLAGSRELHGGVATVNCNFVFTPTPEGAYSRMFGPEHGVVEDPATGSATGPLAAYMMRHGLAGSRDGTRFVSEQGTKMGRRSYLHVLVHGDDGRDGIEIGGDVVAIASGTLRIPVA